MKAKGFQKLLDPGQGLIFFLGLGYFLSYIPYSLLTKATTKGLLPSVAPTSGFVILPVSAIATLIAMYVFVTAMGWWKHLSKGRFGGISLPLPRKATLISGIATAVIIGTTTLAFSFNGVSIIFSLVLMRSGVLIISRVTDAVVDRKVHWFSLTAMILTLLALVLIFAEDGGYAMTLVAALNIAAYLSGYVVRFQVMDRLAKNEDREDRIRYFVEEQMVAMPVLVLTLAVSALIGGGDLMLEVREGFSPAFFAGSAFVPAMLIGLGYAILYIFGTMIYLDPREYTFCVPVNRAFSILSGVVASFALAFFFQYPIPSAYQLSGAALLVLALLILGVPFLNLLPRRQATGPLHRLVLFVCSGNRLRSPIAQAICNTELAARFNTSVEGLSQSGIYAQSAGVLAQVGQPLRAEAERALASMGMHIPAHTARLLTHEQIAQAERIYCMTEAQCQVVVDAFPAAATKVRLLYPGGDLEEPDGQVEIAKFAERVQELIRRQLDELLASPNVSAHAQ